MFSKALGLRYAAFLLLMMPPFCATASPKPVSRAVVQAINTCELVAKAHKFSGKLVKVRGEINGNGVDAVWIEDAACPNDIIALSASRDVARKPTVMRAVGTIDRNRFMDASDRQRIFGTVVGVYRPHYVTFPGRAIDVIDLLEVYDSAPSPSVPQIACQIIVQSWCITNGVEKISMTETDHRRTWMLEDRAALTSGPFSIIENEPNCSQGQPVSVRRLYARADGAFLVVRYSLTEREGCYLEFRLPEKDGKPDGAYRHAMLYQILIDGRQLQAFDDFSPIK